MKSSFPWELIIAIFIGCFSVNTHADDNLLCLHGSNTIGAALAPELARGWLHSKGYRITSERMTAEDERLIVAKKVGAADMAIEIYAHGSSTAFRDLAAGRTDIGMASRPIKSEELKKLARLGQLNRPNTEYIIALDGLSVIVNRKNPLKQISKDKLQKIFSGRITDWSQLGLPRGHINVYARDNNSGTYDTFKHLVLSKAAPLLKTARRYESNAKLSDDVSNDTYGIGFVGLAYVRKSHALAIAEAGATALYPTEFNVATEDYTLSRRLYLYVPEVGRHPLASSFAEYAQSGMGQKIAAQVGFVSQEVIAYNKPANKKAPKEYQQLVKNAKRLSLNIRFNQGQQHMDNKAMHDVDRLMGFMSKPENKDKRLMLLGFADSNEIMPYFSLSLSIERADSVADKLLTHKLIPDRVRGYGQEMPVSSNQSEQGRVRNRRVEVWVHDTDWK